MSFNDASSTSDLLKDIKHLSINEQKVIIRMRAIKEFKKYLVQPNAETYNKLLKLLNGYKNISSQNT